MLAIMIKSRVFNVGGEEGRGQIRDGLGHM